MSRDILHFQKYLIKSLQAYEFRHLLKRKFVCGLLLPVVLRLLLNGIVREMHKGVGVVRIVFDSACA